MDAACTKMLEITIHRPPYREAAAPDSNPDTTRDIDRATTSTNTVV